MKIIEEYGGESEIRTHDTFNSIQAFQACAENLAACSTISFVSESYIQWESAVNHFICKKSPARVRSLESNLDTNS